MRSILLAALALTSLVPLRDADACGGSFVSEPRVFRLSSHYIPGANRRTFALVTEAAPKHLVWSQLAPMSYDATQIAAGPAIASPVTLTLVGPSGTRVVSATDRVFLSRSWDFDAATGALEVPTGDEDFTIALSGRFANAEWRELEEAPRFSKSKILDWVIAQGVTPSDPDELYVRHVNNTYAYTITLFPKNGTKMITLVMRGNKNIGRFEGSPVGAFSIDWVTKLAIVDGARVATVQI